MAYPVVETTSTGTTVVGTSHALTLPSGIVTGNLLIAFASFSTRPSTGPSGWTLLVKETYGPPYGCIYYRFATGSEGSSITFTLLTNGYSAYNIYRLSGAHPTTAPELNDQYTGYDNIAYLTGYNFNPANWGTETTLWVACEVHTGNYTTTSVSADLTNLLTANTTDIGIGTARAELTAYSYQNSPTSHFHLPSTRDYDTWMVAVRPAPPPPAISSLTTSWGWKPAATMSHGFGSQFFWGQSGMTFVEDYPIAFASSFGWSTSLITSKGQVGKTHHLKVGNEYLMVRSNTYQKRRAPTFGARISTGDPDYNNLSIWQHWVQKCWVGGMGADRWVDPEMFDAAVGVDTTVHEEMRLSRALKRGLGANWDLGGDINVANYDFLVFGSRLYCLVTLSPPLPGVAANLGVVLPVVYEGHMVFPFSLSTDEPASVLLDSTTSRLYAYSPLTESWASVAMPGIEFSAHSITAYCGKMFIGGSDFGSSALYYSSVPGTWTQLENPVDTSGNVTALRVFNQRLYVSFDTQVWRLTDLFEWDGNTVFYTANANSGSNYIAAMEPHLGFLYMLSQNGHLHRTDGNNTFDIWSWDGQTAGVSLKSYDNKLFVGTYEYTDTPDLGFGVLYQFTGAAVTELKRWGKVGKATSIGKMTVYGRRLYYGAGSLLGEGDGFGVAMYDSVNDAHSIYALDDNPMAHPDSSGVGNAWLVDAVFVFGGKLFAAVRGHGMFFTQDTFKDSQMNLAQYITTPTVGSIYSSLYDAGTPGLEKLWHKITVYCALPVGTSMTVAYSLDNGLNWIDFGEAYGPGPANEQFVFKMDNVRSTQFKWKIRLATTDEHKSPLVKGVVVAYLPQPEPNWMWSFTVPVSDKWTLMDGTEEVKDPEALIAYMERLFRNQEMVQFIDIDGVQWAEVGNGAIIYDMVTSHYDIEDPREADLRMTIMETVESYA
jgi:hypothetical protein